MECHHEAEAQLTMSQRQPQDGKFCDLDFIILSISKIECNQVLSVEMTVYEIHAHNENENRCEAGVESEIGEVGLGCSRRAGNLGRQMRSVESTLCKDDLTDVLGKDPHGLLQGNVVQCNFISQSSYIQSGCVLPLEIRCSKCISRRSVLATELLVPSEVLLLMAAYIQETHKTAISVARLTSSISNYWKM